MATPDIWPHFQSKVSYLVSWMTKTIGLCSHTIENWITGSGPPCPQTLHSLRLLILAQVSEGKP